MTIKEFKEQTSPEEQKEFAKKLHCWLGCYTSEAIKEVWSKMEQIINDEVTMQLIDELYIRTNQEKANEIDYFEISIGYAYYDMNNHILTHSKSYRDVLDDMYIKKI